MTKGFKRTAIFRVNPFQRRLFYPVMVAFFAGCFVSWLSMIYFLIGDYFFSPALYRFQKAIPALLAAATVLMIIVIFWTFRISARYFGSYKRMLRELDEVLAGERKAPLKTRKGDVIFEELLKRVNALIEQRP